MAQIRDKMNKLLYSALWMIGLSAGLAMPQTSAEAATPTELAELACQEALQLNTIEALEDYLRRYPEADTACKALALDALSQFSVPGEDERGDSGTGGTDGGYGG